MHTSAASLLAFAASVQAVYKGFNYASTNGDKSPRTAADFTEYFKTAQKLVGTSGFSSARLYTMIQAGTTADPISAIDAAIATNTTLLLGLWASGDGYPNELNALKAAIAKYGSTLSNIVAGISIGSEDMYRISPIGIAAKSGLGLDPDTLVSYIKQAREVVAGTPLAAARFGHVDTSNAWVNASNAAVAEAVDWIGMDAYPFFETTMTNDIGSAKGLFEKAINEVKAATGNKELLITETGWPISGPSQNLGVASLDNAEMFWQEVGCAVFDKISTWWYILSETGAEPDFSVVVDPSNPTPKYNLVCKSNAGLNLAGASTSSATATTVTSTNSTSGQGFNSASSSNSSSSGSGSSSNPGSGTSTAPTTTGTPHSAANAKFFSAGAAVVAVLAAVLAL